MWGSLKAFMGTSTDSEMDSTWNPRNRYLADVKLLTDVKEYGCDDDEVYALPPSVMIPGFSGEWARIVCYFPNSLVAGAMEWGLKDLLELLASTDRFPGAVSALWPVTRKDEAHIAALPRFVVCRGPVPGVADMRLTRSGSTITATWTPVEGCVRDIELEDYRLHWHVQFQTPLSNDGYRSPLGGQVTAEPPGATSSQLDVSGHLLYGVYPLAPATLESVKIELADVVLGEQHYEHRLNITSN